MAICLRRFSKNLGSFSLTRSRQHVTFFESRLQQAALPLTGQITECEAKPTHSLSPLLSTLCSSITVPRPFQATSDDLIVWSRGLPHHEAARLCFQLGGNKPVLLSRFERQMILLSEGEGRRVVKEGVGGARPEGMPTGRPNEGQLERVYKVLHETMPKLFVKSLDYSVYHRDLVFENNIRGTKTIGLYPYMKQMSLLRTVGHLRFAFVKLDILKMTAHPEDGTVKIRWRIRGISGLKVVVFFWRYKLWDIKEALNHLEGWYDGFSTFYVGGDGLIHKHVADKMMPDSDESVVPKTPLAAKVALLLGLFPRDPTLPLASLSTFLSLPTALERVSRDSNRLSQLMLPPEQLE